jgi:transcription elongation factor GreA
MEKFQITKEGFAKLRAEIENLKNIERPKVINQIATARELGDLKENAEYHAAREKQGMIEAMLVDLEGKFSRAEVIDISTLSGDKVKFGATVTLENLDNSRKVTYKIVSEFEADIDQGLISSTSPVARSLMGKAVGDDVEIITPGGEVSYEVLEVKFIN